MIEPSERTVVVRGAGDLGTGVLYRLWKAGFSPVALERKNPLTVRRQVAFAAAVRRGENTVESVTARRVEHPEQAQADVPVLVDPDGEYVRDHDVDVLVDATMVRQPEKILLRPDQAELTIGLGPGFRIGEHADLVVETNRGHHLGRVYHEGTAEPATGVPGSIQGEDRQRVLRAPADGTVELEVEIGQQVREGQRVATVSGEPATAGVDGVIRGLIAPETPVHKGLKIGDVDPRGHRSSVDRISDKARAVGGGVLEAIFWRYCRQGDRVETRRFPSPYGEPERA